MPKIRSKSNKGRVLSIRRRPRLLLVDENAEDLNVYTGMLHSLGYDVRPFDSYSQAAASLGAERFDLIFVDQGSTSFEGRSVLTRALEIDNHGPILVLTRNVDVDCFLEALDARADEYVQKPLTMTELKDLVNDYLPATAGPLPVARKSPLRSRFAGLGKKGRALNFRRTALSTG